MQGHPSLNLWSFSVWLLPVTHLMHSGLLQTSSSLPKHSSLLHTANMQKNTGISHLLHVDSMQKGAGISHLMHSALLHTSDHPPSLFSSLQDTCIHPPKTRRPASFILAVTYLVTPSSLQHSSTPVTHLMHSGQLHNGRMQKDAGILHLPIDHTPVISGV
jgi:hypothetical protein